MTSFGNFIRSERERLGWTQTDLGAKLGINSGAISKIERGKKYLSASKLNLVAILFSIDLPRVKELYFGEKFAREVFKNECPESVFEVAQATIKYLKSKNAKQSKIVFGGSNGV